jgi:O-antigen ligase
LSPSAPKTAAADPPRATRTTAGLVIGSELVLLISMLVLLGTVNNAESGDIRRAGLLIIMAGLVFGAVLLLSYKAALLRIPAGLKPLLIAAGVYVAIYLVALVQQGHLRGLNYSIGQLVMLLIFFFLIASLRWTNTMLLILSWCFTLFFTFICAWWFIAGLPWEFVAHMTNPNLSGMYAGFGLFFICLGLLSRQPLPLKFIQVGVAILTVALVINNNSRAVVLGLLAALAIWYFWPRLTASRRRMRALFFTLATAIILFVVVYPLLHFTPVYEPLQQLSYELTGKNVYSGRQLIWLMILEVLSHKPVLGYGPYFIPENVLDTDLSAHNLYLQVALQVGIVGVIALGWLLYRIWLAHWPGRHDNRVRLAGAFFIALMVQQTFDVSLTQHNPAQAFAMWLMLGVGVALSLNCRNSHTLELSSNEQADLPPPAAP